MTASTASRKYFVYCDAHTSQDGTLLCYHVTPVLACQPPQVDNLALPKPSPGLQSWCILPASGICCVSCITICIIRDPWSFTAPFRGSGSFPVVPLLPLFCPSLTSLFGRTPAAGGRRGHPPETELFCSLRLLDLLARLFRASRETRRLRQPIVAAVEVFGQRGRGAPSAALSTAWCRCGRWQELQRDSHPSEWRGEAITVAECFLECPLEANDSPGGGDVLGEIVSERYEEWSLQMLQSYPFDASVYFPIW